MIDKANLDKTNAWPFIEAKKILNERETSIKKKGKIILQTAMALADFHILVLLVKLLEHP